MLIINDYSNFRFTKIQAPITLKKCPSDSDCSEYYIDISQNSFTQENCYIGDQFVEEIRINRITGTGNRGSMIEPQWLVEMIIPAMKTEEEATQIIDNLCEILTLHCVQWYEPQYSGIAGFSCRSIEIKRSYAVKDKVFGDIDMNRYGDVSMNALSTIQANIFELPTEQKAQTPLAGILKKALLDALKSRDEISRYILSYYLFEIMYSTAEYQVLKDTCEKKWKNQGCHIEGNEKRSKILYQYLIQSFSLKEYSFFNEISVLTPQILCEIIKTRNDLTHRADRSKTTHMLYHHLLPILQQIVIQIN